MFAIRKHTLAPLIPFLFFTCGTLASSLMLEAGAYSSEIAQAGYYTGGWYRYVIYMVLSILEYFVIFRMLSPRLQFERVMVNERLIIILFAVSLLFYSAPVFYYGPAVLIELNRYEFMDLPHVKFFNIKLYIAVMAFYLGLTAGPGGSYRAMAKTLFFALIIVMLMYGEKVSGPITAFISYYGGLLMASQDNKIKLAGLLKIGLGIAGFFLLIYYLWGAMAGHTADIIFDAFLDRASRQGQVWWKLDELANYQGGAMGKSVLDNLNNYAYASNNPLGNQYIKSLLMPAELYQMHSGSLAAVYPGILYLNNDFYTFLAYALVMNAIYWIVQIAIYFYSFRSFAIYALPATCAWYAVHLKIFQSGNIYLISHINYLAGLTFFLIILLLFQYMRRTGRKLPATSTHKVC